MLSDKKEFLYAETTYKINGLLFSVHNELGMFAREKQYADSFETKLKESGIAYRRELRIGDSGNILDFLIDDLIIIELKSKPFLLREDYFQTQRYLDSLNLRLGILVNFRTKYLQPKRILRKL